MLKAKAIMIVFDDNRNNVVERKEINNHVCNKTGNDNVMWTSYVIAHRDDVLVLGTYTHTLTYSNKITLDCRVS